MTHPSPERWADLVAGRVDASEAEALVAHAAACKRCAAARARVEAASSSMQLLGAASPPPISWDRVGAQLYWTASRELRRPPRPRRLWPFAAAGIAAGAAAVILFASSGPLPVPAPAPTPAPASISSVPAPPAPHSTPLEAAVTFLQGDVTAGAVPVTPDTPLHAGMTLHAGRGRLAAQFGPRSGFVLEPGGTLEIVAFDSREIALRVTSGAVAVELESRAADQRFAVLAGTRIVEVRGTVFRVAEQAGDVDVAVRRGHVAVLDGDAAVDVPAGARLALARGAAIGSLVPERASDALAESMRVPLCPDFSDARTLRASAPMLAVTAPPRARVLVDGVEAGSGSFQIRRAGGRHIVESGAAARWVEVEAGRPAQATLVDRTRSERPGQLDAQLRANRAAVGRCADTERKAAPGWTGEVEVEIGILADGSVDFVAPVRPSATPTVEDCVLDLIRDRFTFPSGSAATVRKVIAF